MDAEFETELKDLVADGRKIEAIKLYREETGAGLKEAKEAIEAFERDGVMLTPERNRDFSNTEDEITSLLERGQKIEAIKRYREQTGAGLKQAKEAVEEIARQRGIPMRSGCFGVILIAIGLALWAIV